MLVAMNNKLLLVGVTAALALSMSACSDESDTTEPGATKSAAASASASASASAAASRAAAPSVSASRRADAEDQAGLAPAPDAGDAKGFISALREIDPDIVTGASAEAVVERGRAHCTQLYNEKSQSELIAGANTRFATNEHPDGFGTAKGKMISDVVRKYICPKNWTSSGS